MSKKRNIPPLAAAALTAALLAGCAGDSPSDIAPTPSADNTEIKVNANVWQMMEGTRATTFDSPTAIQQEGSFTCTAYDAGTTTPNTTSNVNGSLVNWNTGASRWEFGEVHRWPTSGSLDFFAYMPATPPTYITAVNYTTALSPVITCTDLPMTYQNAYTDESSAYHAEAGQGSGMKEFVCALATGQNRVEHGSSGVTMTFKHPFARLNFQLSANHPDIQINSITFKALKSGGTCTFNGTSSTWTSLTPSEGTVDFVMTLNGSDATFNNNPASTLPIGPTILMVPQTFAGDIVVNATWTDWGEPTAHTVNTTLPSSITWEAGKRYTYTFTITETDLTVDGSKYTEQW